MKIIHYCQHILGMGHFFRSLEIARALDKEEVLFVSGGSKPDQDLPSNVKYIQLPGLCMDEKFGGLMTTDPNLDLEEVKIDRAATLLHIFQQERPDIFLIELFPFGRKAFRFELLPVLDTIKDGQLGNIKVVCSLRDILVERNDGGKHEKRVVKYLNKYFDRLLIHSDPQIASLDETFQLMDRITIPYSYTGFTARKPDEGVRESIRTSLGISANEKLLIASAGGGKVGRPLMEAVFKSFSCNSPENAKLLMLTGPFYDQENFNILHNAAENFKNITVRKFASDFTNLLTAADAMISMAGYNTCMDILTSGIPAAVLPFAQNSEQRMRAEKLTKYVPIRVLETKDLVASGMDNVINALLVSCRTSQCHAIGLDGANTSAEIIREYGKN